jgi:hypothetical protein
MLTTLNRSHFAPIYILNTVFDRRHNLSTFPSKVDRLCTDDIASRALVQGDRRYQHFHHRFRTCCILFESAQRFPSWFLPNVGHSALKQKLAAKIVRFRQPKPEAKLREKVSRRKLKKSPPPDQGKSYSVSASLNLWLIMQAVPAPEPVKHVVNLNAAMTKGQSARPSYLLVLLPHHLSHIVNAILSSTLHT